MYQYTTQTGIVKNTNYNGLGVVQLCVVFFFAFMSSTTKKKVLLKGLVDSLPLPYMDIVLPLRILVIELLALFACCPLVQRISSL